MTASETDALIGEATKGIADEDARKARTDALTAMLQVENPPASEFPEQWRSEPNVMFEAGDPQPEPFAWGERQWTTERAYDEDLGKFLGELACGPDVAEGSNLPGRRRASPIAFGRGSSPRASLASTARRPTGCPATCAAGWKNSQRKATRRPLLHEPPRPLPSSKAL
jgi:hypothetical protein